MAFLHRLGYYLGGFSIGLVALFFILNGKKTRCNYGPQARVLDHLSKKEWKTTTPLMDGINLDSIGVQKLLRGATIDFSKSDTKRDSCKRYHVKGFLDDTKVEWDVENCNKVVYIKSFKVNP
ncbi:MAG: hypothetical protein ACPG8F_01355 [Flavobacteriaceae bacterium]